MRFMRLKNSSGRGLAEAYDDADPRALVASLLTIIESTLLAEGPQATVLKILAETDRWEAVGPDAAKEYGRLTQD